MKRVLPRKKKQMTMKWRQQKEMKMDLTMEMAASRSIFKPLGAAYLDFKRLRPNDSLRSLESMEDSNSVFKTLFQGNVYSIESLDVKGIVKKFIDGAIRFIQEILKLIAKIVFAVVNFFKKLIINAMDMKYIMTRSEYYETHKQAIMENYNKFAGTCQIDAIPPKNIRAFNSDNKITLCVSQTLNLLEEIEQAFKQRYELWEEQNKRPNNTEGKTIFQQLAERLRTVRIHITDSMILASLGIRLQYDLGAIAFYDPQVKEYLLETVSDLSPTHSNIQFLKVIFRVHKAAMNIYLYGKPDAKAEMISIADYLKFTGPREFDKLTATSMKNIRANMVTINGLVQKMENISTRLNEAGTKFIASLQKNMPILLQIAPGSEEVQESLSVIQEWILPLLPMSSSIFSYFNNAIIDYSMQYCIHRKNLVESAMLLVSQGK
jgi:hypothetical protein